MLVIIEADSSSGKDHLYLRSWDSAETLNEVELSQSVLCVCCKEPIKHLSEQDIADITPGDLFICKNIALLLCNNCPQVIHLQCYLNNPHTVTSGELPDILQTLPFSCSDCMRSSQDAQNTE